VGCGPDSEKGADIMMYKLNDRYLMKALTPGGEEIFTNIDVETEPATSQDIVEKDDLVNKACQMVKRFVDIDEFKEKLNNFQGPWWEKLAQKCLGCGICTYFCPTCHCFDVTDEVVKQFNYAVEYYGETFCVGCGRCIIHCPVNIDIRQIIMDIAEER
jgi:ferredoxin